jgi:hypothetical protein
VTYRRYYRRAKGGVFRSRPHLLSHMVTDGLLTEDKARDVRQRAEALRAQSFGKPAPGTAPKPQQAKPKAKAPRAKAAKEAKAGAKSKRAKPQDEEGEA